MRAGKRKSNARTETQMQYSPKLKLKEEKRKVVDDGRPPVRLMSFRENLVEVGLDQRTRIGPFVGVLTGEQTPA